MPATTWAEMEAGRLVLRAGLDHLQVRIKRVDLYSVRDMRAASVTGREETATNSDASTWVDHNYDTTRSLFNTSMVNLEP